MVYTSRFSFLGPNPMMVYIYIYGVLIKGKENQTGICRVLYAHAEVNFHFIIYTGTYIGTTIWVKTVLYCFRNYL